MTVSKPLEIQLWDFGRYFWFENPTSLDEWKQKVSQKEKRFYSQYLKLFLSFSLTHSFSF